MKKALKKIFTLLLGAALLTGCASLDPAARYAKEHEDKRFKSWEDEAKKAKKADKKKVREHWQNKHTWAK